MSRTGHHLPKLVTAILSFAVGIVNKNLRREREGFLSACSQNVHILSKNRKNILHFPVIEVKIFLSQVNFTPYETGIPVL
jgi:hypothetical protein